MRLVKIGLASVNTTVGATHANVERALPRDGVAVGARDGRRGAETDAKGHDAQDAA